MDQLIPDIKRDLYNKYGHLMIKWYESVDWTEPLIVGLISFHALLFATVFLTRKHLSVQFALFFLVLLLLLMAQRLNAWGRTHWNLVATQNYFDGSGLFMAMFYAGPLLFIGFFQLLLSMKSMAEMVIFIKRAELRQRQQQVSKKQK